MFRYTNISQKRSEKTFFGFACSRCYVQSYVTSSLLVKITRYDQTEKETDCYKEENMTTIIEIVQTSRHEILRQLCASRRLQITIVFQNFRKIMIKWPICSITWFFFNMSTDWNQPDLWPPTAKIQPIPTQPSSAAWVPAKIQGLSINAPRRPATTRATRACQHQSLTSITTLRKLISRSCCFAWFLHKRGLRASGAKKPSHTWFPAESELRPAAISSATRLHHQTTAHGSLSSLHKQTPSISPRRRPFWPHRRWRCRCRGLAVARPVNVCPKVEKHYGAETNGCCPTVAGARKTATRRSPPTLFLYVL